jgi:hypothetical protein
MKAFLFVLILSWTAAAKETSPTAERGKAAAHAPKAELLEGLPKEIVIKGEQAPEGLMGSKPPLRLEIDAYETLRPSLEVEPGILLAVSPLTVSWRRTYPDILSNRRVLEPWRTPVSASLNIVFRVREKLSEAFQRKIEAREAKSYAWRLTIADEEGRVFQHYEDSRRPPQELLWSGHNENGEWIRAGRSYSAVYTFTDPGGSPRTSVGKPILFALVVHQEESGLHISLDSSVLFGPQKASDQVSAAGSNFLRSAADIVKRGYSGIPLGVQVFAGGRELGLSQGKAISAVLQKELMIPTKSLSVDVSTSAFSEQRVEIVVLNR